MTAHIIYKHELDIDKDVTVVPLHEGADILLIEAVNDQVCMWVREKPDNVLIGHKLAVVATGDPLPPDATPDHYVGGAVLLGGRLAVHVFDLGVVLP